MLELRVAVVVRPHWSALAFPIGQARSASDFHQVAVTGGMGCFFFTSFRVGSSPLQPMLFIIVERLSSEEGESGRVAASLELVTLNKTEEQRHQQSE